MELIGLYLIGCGLLVCAGVMKAARPDDTARAVLPLLAGSPALRSLPQLRRMVRLGAATEAALGVVALVLPRPLTASLVAVSYVAFTGYVLYVRSRGGALTSCGCFGTPDGPPTILHATLTAGFAIAAVAVATLLAQAPLHGAPLVALSAVGLWLTYLALTVLGRLQAVRHSAGATR